MDVRPGGAYRHDFAGPEGAGFSIVGAFLEVEPGRHLVHVESMLLPDRAPDCRIETLFEAEGDGARTRLTLHMSLPDARARAAMHDSGMSEGIEMTHVSLDALLAAGEVWRAGVVSLSSPGVRRGGRRGFAGRSSVIAISIENNYLHPPASSPTPRPGVG